VNSCGYLRCPRDWHLGPDRTTLWPDLDLWVLTEGHGTLESNGVSYSLEPGSCGLLRGGEPYTFVPDPEHRFCHYWVHFHFVDTHGAALPHVDLPLPPLLRRLRDLPFVQGLLDRLLRAHRRQETPRQVWVWMRAILDEIRTEDQDAEDATVSPHAEALDAICTRLREHPQHHHRVDDLARELDLDPSYFSRLFRAHTGLSPRHYLTNARMQLARFLLRDSQLTVSRIAERAGYADVRFFARHFREHHGLSPSAYRSNQAPSGD
jgi:AraC-like DNA-binding protein